MAMYRTTAGECVLTERIAPLLFGFFAWPDGDEKRVIKEAGTGVFVAPRLGLSARHLSKSFEKFDPQFAARERRKTPLDPQYEMKPVVCNFASMIYQVPRYNSAPIGEDHILWKPLAGFGSFDTDIISVLAEPRTSAAVGIEAEQRFFEWQLLPPPVGSRVLVFGLPEQEIEVEGENHAIGAGVWMWAARVERHHRFFAHGFGDFPVYELHRELPGGFSGAPVIYKGRLAGIFVGPKFVACLWPLAIHTYQDEEKRDYSFAAHLDTGMIRACDWDEVKGRVHRVHCSEVVAGLDVDACSKTHVALHD